MDGAIPTDGTLDGTPGDPATQPRAGLPGATAGLGLAGLIDVLDRADGMLPRQRPRPRRSAAFRAVPAGRMPLPPARPIPALQAPPPPAAARPPPPARSPPPA